MWVWAAKLPRFPVRIVELSGVDNWIMRADDNSKNNSNVTGVGKGQTLYTYVNGYYNKNKYMNLNRSYVMSGKLHLRQA